MPASISSLNAAKQLRARAGGAAGEPDRTVANGPQFSRKLLFVSGLLREARAVQRRGLTALCSGTRGDVLRSKLAELDPTSFSGVISFGIAGGLDPSLSPGDILIGSAVFSAGEWTSTRNDLSAALMNRFENSRRKAAYARFVGSENPILCLGEKALLHRQTGASAVDTESHVAAEWAARHGLPLSILRVVSDPAHRDLPSLAAIAFKANGRLALRRIFAEFAREPRQIRAMAHAARDARAAFAALNACAKIFGSPVDLTIASVLPEPLLISEAQYGPVSE